MNQLNVNLPELPYAVSEAMNRLRINIKFCGKNTRKILLTSCQPNEGKSTISSYLWKMLAEAGFPTVLVDVDLRKSVMKTRFQMDYDDDTTMGLNHYLSGMAEYCELPEIFRLKFAPQPQLWCILVYSVVSLSVSSTFRKSIISS